MQHEDFDWDQGNIEHLTDFTPEEVEEAVLDPDRIGADAYNALGERRWALLGATVENDILFVVYTRRHGKVSQPAEIAMAETPHSNHMTTVHSDQEVPSFESESEEAAFWQTHRLSDELLESMEPITDDSLPPARTKPVSFRLDDHTVARAKSLAARRGIGYQTMLKQFMVERLYEEEKREGISR